MTEHKAGRDPATNSGTRLDVLIHTEVFGHPRNVPVMCDPGFLYRQTEAGWVKYSAPAYSADISAAWLVHLHMCNSDPETKSLYFHALRKLLMEHGSYSVWTAALEYLDAPTICRAALAALSRDGTDRGKE